ncbi:hypothetical protein ACRALDRAFT_2113393 [Sodiomyces alcalophilus JCM 7366]|uniref:uncharacterized protein n=1 Tax=Sodiomyces alcalophilus JCM 7366 TaxID=591952 RepID=UPI0039B5CD42
MGPPLEVSRLTLNYPPYSCEFDPQDATRLLVGGGGGANRSGVANRITAIDTSSRNEMRIAGEIDLSRDEDSVNTIAVGQKKPGSAGTTLVYAGINSSPADIDKGEKNEHFRVFSLSATTAAVKASDEKKPAHAFEFSELSRTALFDQKPDDKEAYQRLLRLSSPLYPGRPQLGAVATGFAKQAQIALFHVGTGATAPTPRGVLELSKEATDLDVVQTGDDSFQVAYCDDRDIFVVNVDNKTGDTTGPDLVYSMPDTEADSGVKPSFRAIRYLSPGFIMAVSNLPKQTGVILSGIRLPAPDKLSETEARLAVSAKLPRFMNRATSFAVRNLNPPTSPGAPLGDTQFVLAVAGKQSVCLYSVEHRSGANIDLLVNLLPLATLKEIHRMSITSLAFSVFLPPSTSPSSSKPAPPGLNLLLASVAMDNSVAVHSIPLKKLAEKPASSSQGPARYAVAFAPQNTGPRNVIIALTVTVLILAAVVQYVISTGIDPALLFPGRPSLSRSVDVAAPSSLAGSTPIITSAPVPTIEPEVLTPGMFLSRLLPDFPGLRTGDIYVLREDDELEKRDVDEEASMDAPRRIRAVLHDEETHGPAAEWEALSAEQRELWKKRLADAGYWAEHMGEGVFKGVVFKEIAGVVERTVGG